MLARSCFDLRFVCPRCNSRWAIGTCLVGGSLDERRLSIRSPSPVSTFLGQYHDASPRGMPGTISNMSVRLWRPILPTNLVLP
jgi:hypothetical protein